MLHDLERRKSFQRGVPQIYDVMDHVHEGYNYSNDDMIFSIH